jgi:hypothetical protein
MVYVAGLLLLLWSAASLLVLALCSAAARGDRQERAARRTARVQARLRACPAPAARATTPRGARGAGPHAVAEHGVLAVPRAWAPRSAARAADGLRRRGRPAGATASVQPSSPSGEDRPRALESRRRFVDDAMNGAVGPPYDARSEQAPS